MKVGLFIPCYVDQFYPKVAVATLELLEKLGCEVVFPLNQTCCGQPMANSGFASLSEGCDKNFVANIFNSSRVVASSANLVISRNLCFSATMAAVSAPLSNAR